MCVYGLGDKNQITLELQLIGVLNWIPSGVCLTKTERGGRNNGNFSILEASQAVKGIFSVF